MFESNLKDFLPHNNNCNITVNSGNNNNDDKNSNEITRLRVKCSSPLSSKVTPMNTLLSNLPDVNRCRDFIRFKHTDCGKMIPSVVCLVMQFGSDAELKY